MGRGRRDAAGTATGAAGGLSLNQPNRTDTGISWLRIWAAITFLNAFDEHNVNKFAYERIVH